MGIWNVGWAASADQYLEGSPVDRFVFSALLVLGLGVLLTRLPQVIKVLRANPAIIVFYFYCALSTLWSDFPDVAFKRWTKLLTDLVMVLVVVTDRDPTRAIKRLFSRVVFFLIPLSILFIRYYPELGRVYTRWEGALLNTGVTTDKNTFGMICMMSGLVALWRLLTSGQEAQAMRKRSRVAYGAILLMAIWLLWQADSATSTTCFLMMGILLVLVSLPKLIRRRAVLHVIVFSMLTSCILALFVAPALLVLIGRNPTLTGRTIIWQNVLSLDSSPIFGAGFESFWLGSRLETLWRMFPGDGRFHPNEAHNGYIEIYLSLGAVGLAILVFLILSGYRHLTATVLHNRASHALRLGFCVGAIAYNFTEAAFKELHPLWICFLWAIIAIPEGRGAKKLIPPKVEHWDLSLAEARP
ncbi:MAG TPA: O-antigen ligase family protein [Bryobacteraceae bacterium]|nr:O-antigen ligase family protein [Bryobacteraceae bacterium]